MKKLVTTLAASALIVLAISFSVYAIYRIVKHMRWERDVNEIVTYCANHDEMRRFYVSDGCSSADAYIAHGGGINEYVYTNSHEAVEDSLGKGFKFIEIDIHVTADGHVVGIHDCDQFKDFTGMDNIDLESATWKQLKNLKIKGKYSILDGKAIARFMEENPDLVLVTDKIDDYDLLLREIPFPDRLIVEVFSVEDYAKALRAGVKYPAFCLWEPGTVPVVESLKIPIVTMNARAFFEKADTIAIAQRLHDNQVTILLFSAMYVSIQSMPL